MTTDQKNIALVFLIIVCLVSLMIDAACFFVIVNCIIPYIFQIQIAFGYLKCVVCVILLRFLKNIFCKTK